VSETASDAPYSARLCRTSHRYADADYGDCAERQACAQQDDRNSGDRHSKDSTNRQHVHDSIPITKRRSRRPSECFTRRAEE
jgi:hypothetical protein